MFDIICLYSKELKAVQTFERRLPMNDYEILVIILMVIGLIIQRDNHKR